MRGDRRLVDKRGFARDEAGIVFLVVGIVVGVVVLVGATAGGLYLSDYALEATVIDKDCKGLKFSQAANSFVTVKTRIGGFEHTVSDFPNDKCHILTAGEDGNFVQYHIRSGRTILFDEEGGLCIYDSKVGVGCGGQ